MRAPHRIPALLGTILLLWLLAGPPAPVAAVAGCPVLHVHTGWPGFRSTLSKIDLPSGSAHVIRKLGYRVNAIGYARGQRLGYGIADLWHGAGYPPKGGHILTFDTTGTATDHGPPRYRGAPKPPWGTLLPATGATVTGSRWLIKRGSALHTVDIDRDSPAYLHIVRVTALHPTSLASGLHDFDVDPADGRLYGVSTSTGGAPAVVSVDPGTGAIRTESATGLPPATAYGAAAVGPDSALYVTADNAAGRSRLYRVAMDGSGDVRELSAGPPVKGADATGCLTVAPDPTPPSTPSPEPTRPQPTTEPVPPTTERTAPPAAPTTEPVPPRQPPAPPPRRAGGLADSPAQPGPQPRSWRLRQERAEEAEQRTDSTERKRRWGLTALLVIVAGGAAARHATRR